MSFQAPISVADAISRIDQRRLLLPAIQREFIWETQKIEWLFDSLLQDYPVGSFLFWEVRGSDKTQYRYYDFLREFREHFKTHNPEFDTQGHYDFEAVLDGQQRLTALYIGLKGTYAYRLPGRWKVNTEHALPTRRLYLNVGGPPSDADEDQPGRRYEFRFLTDAELRETPGNWFRVGEILEVPEVYQFNRMLNERGFYESEFASESLSKLHAVVHIHKPINYYLIQKSDMERALNVFVRVNRGSEPLSLSDVLMSTLIANWTGDAKKEVLGLVDQIQAQGFFISKDLILKACLYLYSSDIRYKVSNFTPAQVKPFEDNWDAIQKSIVAVFALIKDFGHNERSLTSKNALLPVIYWVHHKGLADGITSQVALRTDRESIRRWLHIMLLKGIFGASADTVLAAIRRVFIDQEFGKPFLRADLDGFPAGKIGAILKDPGVTEEFLDSLLYTEYKEKQAFSILALLAPQLDYKNGNFHEDHLHPRSMFNKHKLLVAGVPESDLSFFLNPQHCNSILNLAHLDSNENKSKQNKPLADWVAEEVCRQKDSYEKFCVNHDLPSEGGALDLLQFRKFIEVRRQLLRARLKESLQ
ncbi:MAG TPA: DUF262 domain-containing protein [Terriglobia bacterium]|nr:DUF262 domain-containing protein [Terriglobia bacterium]